VTVTTRARFDERYYAAVEQLIGRQLREAERHIDVLGLDRVLNAAKDELHHAIEAEKRRAIRRALRGNGLVRLELTRAMLAPLERLFRLGRREAVLELAAAGYQARALEAEPMPELRNVADLLRRRLRGVSVRVQSEWVALDLRDLATNALLRALYRTPGARDAASRVVSKALTSGLSATFSDAGGTVTSWEYTSVLDGGTCDVCAELDGTTYDTIDELFAVLPDFGPNPLCDGGDRCRCRAVPA
jgi:hypothetical protein